jgi:CO/xanthine dehydrogenase FAD-binding subunit
MSVYLAPESLADALSAVAAGARPIAGGTDLVVGARHGKAPLPESLCAIHRVRELAGIRTDGSGAVVLGALASHAAIAAHPEIRARFTGLADASAIVGSHATRNTGTIGGNVMNGSSAEADELLTSVLLPAPAVGTGSCYVRLEYRRHMEIAIVGVGCQLTRAGDGTLTGVRIAITALAPTIHRIPEAEALLEGGDGGDAIVRAAGDAVAAASRPISDVRGSDRYRRAMAAVIARRAIAAALTRAAGGDVAIPASLAQRAAEA